MKEQRIFAVSGVKDSGKTTLISRLIPHFKRKGLSVSVIKHDGHDFIPDVPERTLTGCGAPERRERRYFPAAGRWL